ncbi:MAG: tetratricopeptide repeat protein, partial [Candidatus Syntrophosphaera sp.]
LYNEALATYMRARDYYVQAEPEAKEEENVPSKIELVNTNIARTYIMLAEEAAESGARAYEDELFPQALEDFTSAHDYYEMAEPNSSPADSIDVNLERIQLNIALTYRKLANESDELSMYEDALNEYQAAADIYNGLELLTLTEAEKDDELLVIYNNMAVTAEKAGRYEDALDYYDQVLEYSPGNETVLYTKYTILKDNINDEERAFQVLRDYAGASQNYNAYLILAQAYKESGDNATAGTYYDQALELSEDLDVYTRVADFYRSIGDYEKSNAVLEEFIASEPDQASLATAYRVIAGNYERLGNTGKMVEYYDRSLDVEPNADVALLLANHYYQRKSWNNVINYASQVIDLDASKSAAFLLRGYAYYMNKRYGEARTDLTRIQNDPTHGATARQILNLIK